MKTFLRLWSLLLCCAVLLTIPASARYIGDGNIAVTTVIYSKAIVVANSRKPIADRTLGYNLQFLDVYAGVNEGWYFVYMKGGVGGFAYNREGWRSGNGGRNGAVWGYIYLKPGRYCLSAGSNGYNGANSGSTISGIAYSRGGGGGSGNGYGAGGGGASTIHYIPTVGTWQDITVSNVLAVAAGGGGGGHTGASSASQGGWGGEVYAVGQNNCAYQPSAAQPGYYGPGGRGQCGSSYGFAFSTQDQGNGDGATYSGGGMRGKTTTNNLGTSGSLFTGGSAPTSSWAGGGGAGFYGGGGGSQYGSGNYGDGSGGGGSSYLRSDANFQSYLLGTAGISSAIDAYVKNLVDRHKGNDDFNVEGSNWGGATILDVQPVIIMAYLGPDPITSSSGYTVV